MDSQTSSPLAYFCDTGEHNFVNRMFKCIFVRYTVNSMVVVPIAIVHQLLIGNWPITVLATIIEVREMQVATIVFPLISAFCCTFLYDLLQ